jgi:hypothetical protein
MTHTTSEFIVKMLLFKKNSPDSLDSLAEIIDFLIFFLAQDKYRYFLS